MHAVQYYSTIVKVQRSMSKLIDINTTDTISTTGCVKYTTKGENKICIAYYRAKPV